MRLEWREQPGRPGFGQLVFLKGSVEKVVEPTGIPAREAASVARAIQQLWYRMHPGVALWMGAMPPEGSITAYHPTHLLDSGKPYVWVSGRQLGTRMQGVPLTARNAGFKSAKGKDKWQGKTWNDWWTRTSQRAGSRRY